MAITYRARHTILNSIFALKVIDRSVAQNPVARSRFLREARAAAQVHHPNVARVSHYGEQGGECFYAMEFINGETLEARVRREGPLPLTTALEVSEQVARALAAAGACGVVHRDIKPSNIMIESDASDNLVVKVIDYGVAKVLTPQTEPVFQQTHVGFVGTPAFASPEQFTSAPGESRVDPRSDIYSLGATLWYLLTGRLPFLAGSIEAIHAKQRKDLPLEELKILRVPRPVINLLKSMLAVDPRQRPQSARELLSAVQQCRARFNPEACSRRRRALLAGTLLVSAVAMALFATWLIAASQPYEQIKRSIAVLPFENLSPKPENAYFAIGIQDEILTKLARITDLKVAPQTSTLKYQSKPENLKQVGQELRVATILEGSVQRAANKVRVSVQLIDSRSDSQIWANTYDREIEDLLTVTSEISETVATTLQAKLSAAETNELTSAAILVPGRIRSKDAVLPPPTRENLIALGRSRGGQSLGRP
jgi:serine/threonine protein kinase